MSGWKTLLFGNFPGSWRVQGAPGSLLKSFSPILLPLQPHGAELWPKPWGILFPPTVSLSTLSWVSIGLDRLLFSFSLFTRLWVGFHKFVGNRGLIGSALTSIVLHRFEKASVVVWELWLCSSRLLQHALSPFYTTPLQQTWICRLIGDVFRRFWKGLGGS